MRENSIVDVSNKLSFFTIINLIVVDNFRITLNCKLKKN